MSITLAGPQPVVVPYMHPTLEAMPAAATAVYTTMNRGMVSMVHNCLEMQRDHLERSRLAIAGTALTALKAAPPDTPKNALLLGGGHCLDIPLQAIVATFDHTTLVDADLTSIEVAANRLDWDLQDKISLVGADITGVAAEFARDMKRLAETHASYEAFAEAAGQAVGYLDPATQQPDFGRDYLFVCSQLVLSQLMALPTAFLATRVLRQTYGEQTVQDESWSDDALVTALDKLRNGVQQSHFSLLRRAVAPYGAVHFADTYSVTTRGTDGASMYELYRPLLDDATLDAFITQGFTASRPPREWQWHVADDETFRVVSHALSPAIY